jgi:hypothetical protein
MSEPTSSAVGSLALGKAIGSILGIGVITTVLGFLVLWPKNAHEALVRVSATIAGSFFFGPFLVIAAYSKYPEIFTAAETVAKSFELSPEVGKLAASVPLIALAGLPCWWLLGAVVLWFEKRQGQDIGQLADDAREDARKVLP